MPMFVDLDRTLIHTDMLFESLIAHLRRWPVHIFLLPFWLLRGRAYLKARIADGIHIEAASLPYNGALCELLKDLAAQGRPIYLATASDRHLANAIAAHLGFFSGVIASEGTANLKGLRKLEAIQKIAPEEFDYAGDSPADLSVWRRARQGIVVSASKRLIDEARRSTSVLTVYESPSPNLKTYFRALRIHQWLKNLLVFVPLLTAFQFTDMQAVGASLLAFFAMSLAASATYLINDLLDLPSDRTHPRKRNRPFASGALPITHGLLLAPLSMALGVGMALLHSPQLGLAIVLYVILTSAYSLVLKRYFLIDTLTLALLYTCRIIVGAIAIRVAPSFWILAFSMFIFLSLALVKRTSEVSMLLQHSILHAKGRDYHGSDLGVLYPMGICSGFIAVLVFALYINANEVIPLYRTPEALWVVCVCLLYWIGRMWFKTGRGEMHDDPLVFAVRDSASQALIVIMVLSSAFAHFVRVQ